LLIQAIHGTRKHSTYRCFLPDLTEFTASRCVRPGQLTCGTDPAWRQSLKEGIRPRCSHGRQGTANSPSSTVIWAPDVKEHAAPL